ncbi:MAG: hypothetical protein AB9922_00435 [Bacteroidales bacterium]
MLKLLNNENPVVFRIVYVTVLLLVNVLTANGQNLIETKIVEAGFENVREVENGGKITIYAECTAYVNKERALSVLKDILGNDPELNSRDVELIILSNGIPVTVFKSVAGKDSKGNRWVRDIKYKSNKLVLSNTDREKGGFFNGNRWRADLKFYPQFRFKNSRLDRMYVLQLNLNPTLELNMWKGAKLTTQLIIPVHNEYSLEEGRVRPGFVTLSQHLRMPGNIHIMLTAGNFNMFRTGADLKIFKPVTSKMGIYGQFGVTGWSVPMFQKWLFYDFGQISWRIGANYYLPEKKVLANVNISQYLENDIAVRGEIIRYFKNTSVGFYIQSLQYEGYLINGGFFFSIKLPPYKHNRRKWMRITTGDHFSVEYIARPYPQRGRFYFTSPDESSSLNFFNKLLTGN